MYIKKVQDSPIARQTSLHHQKQKLCKTELHEQVQTGKPYTRQKYVLLHVPCLPTLFLFAARLALEQGCEGIYRGGSQYGRTHGAKLHSPVFMGPNYLDSSHGFF